MAVCAVELAPALLSASTFSKSPAFLPNLGFLICIYITISALFVKYRFNAQFSPWLSDVYNSQAGEDRARIGTIVGLT